MALRTEITEQLTRLTQTEEQLKAMRRLLRDKRLPLYLRDLQVDSLFPTSRWSLYAGQYGLWAYRVFVVDSMKDAKLIEALALFTTDGWEARATSDNASGRVFSFERKVEDYPPINVQLTATVSENSTTCRKVVIGRNPDLPGSDIIQYVCEE